MTKNELTFLKGVIDQRIVSMQKSEHFYHRKTERITELPSYEVLKMFRFSNYEVIECHNENTHKNSFRVLIRSNQVYDNKNFIMVIDIEDRVIVTIYTNHYKHQHAQINKDLYYNYDGFYLHQQYSNLFDESYYLQ